MKKIKIIAMLLFLLCVSTFALGQNSQLNDELVEVKLKLVDSKLQLIETKLELFETTKYDKLGEIDSLIKVLDKKEKNAIRLSKQKDEPAFEYNYKSAFLINPAKLFEGTIFLSYERNITDKFSIDVAFLGTYVTKNGIGRNYMENQFNDGLVASSYDNSMYYYNGEMITGWGIMAEGKNYLKHKSKAPLGLYAGPQIMYRRVNIIGRVYDRDENSGYKDVTDRLDIIRGGVLLGIKTKFAEVLCIDINIGGVMKLSKYTKESSTTKYKHWKSIDYSGILPTINIKIGILK